MFSDLPSQPFKDPILRLLSKNNYCVLLVQYFMVMIFIYYVLKQLMQSELNTKLFEEVIHYVTGAHEDFSLEPSPVANSKYCEIPTAALVTGKQISQDNLYFRYKLYIVFFNSDVSDCIYLLTEYFFVIL